MTVELRFLELLIKKIEIKSRDARGIAADFWELSRNLFSRRKIA